MIGFKRQLDTYGEIDNDCIVCPHCLAEDEESWDYIMNEDESTKHTCFSCGKEHYVVKTSTITYTSTLEEP